MILSQGRFRPLFRFRPASAPNRCGGAVHPDRGPRRQQHRRVRSRAAGGLPGCPRGGFARSRHRRSGRKCRHQRRHDRGYVRPYRRGGAAGTQLVIVQGGYNDCAAAATPAPSRPTWTPSWRASASADAAILCGFYNEPWGAIAQRHGAVFVPTSACYDAAYRGFDGTAHECGRTSGRRCRLLPVVQRMVQQPRRR
jgi:hypothetical protein